MQIRRLHINGGRATVPDRLTGTVAAIGNFDGVHLGHRRVVARAGSLARECAAPLSVISFEPHPREVVAPDLAPARLTSLRQKAAILQGLEVECLFVFAFSRKLMAVPAEDFVRRLLLQDLGVRGIVSGENFRFGHKRGGDIDLLKSLVRQAGASAAIADPFKIGEEPVSSSRVRGALEAGDVALAAAMLGRAHRIGGVVKPGDRRGRTIGFPTANIHPCAGRLCRGRMAMPAHGVYAVRVWDRAGVMRNGVANLGRRPTFDGRTALLEVHLFDYEGDLYGQRLDVEFIGRIRDERKFEAIAALVEQIARDQEQARRILGGSGSSV